MIPRSELEEAGIDLKRLKYERLGLKLVMVALGSTDSTQTLEVCRSSIGVTRGFIRLYRAM